MMLPVSDAQVWLKADAGVLNASDLPASNGEAVKTWQDQSGNFNHVTQTTAARQPTFNTGVLNGMPAVSFDGGDDLQGSYNGECGTIIVVGRAANQSAIRTWAGGKASPGDGIAVEPWYFQTRGLSTRGMQFIRTTAAGSASEFTAMVTDRPAATAYVQIARHDGTAMDLIRQGFIVQSDTTAQALMPIAGLIVGAGWYNESVVDRLLGDIYELIIYDRMLTDEEIALIMAYLTRWFDAPGGGSDFATAPIVSASWLSDAGGASDPGQALYIGTSTDATNFTDALASQWVPDAPDGRVVRDPSLIFNPDDGYWWVAYTHEHWSINSTAFGVMRSKDGRHWDHVHEVDMTAIGSVDFVFAPEFFLDDAPAPGGGLHVIVGVSLTGSSAFEMYEVHPTNSTLTAWSTPVKLTWTPPEPPGAPTSNLDGMVFKKDGVYHLWFTDRSVAPWVNELWKSPSLTGPYAADPNFVDTWQGNGGTVEAPYRMSLGGKIERLYFDQIGWGGGAGQYIESTDGGLTWGSIQSVTRTAKRHGSFVNRSYVDPRVTKRRMTLTGVGQ